MIKHEVIVIVEVKPPPKREEKAEVPPREYYEKVRRESKEAVVGAIPSIALWLTAAVLVWLFGRLVFIPISQGIGWYGYPLPQILNFIILVALVAFVLKMLVDIRRAVDGIAGLAACEIGAPYDVTPAEVEHYRTALRGLFYVIVVSLAFLLFSDYLALIHPGLSGVVLIVIVIWAIYQIWRVVKAISEEIRRYSARWAGKALE